MKRFAAYLTLFTILVSAQSASEPSEMNGSKGQVDNRMTPPPPPKVGSSQYAEKQSSGNAG